MAELGALGSGIRYVPPSGAVLDRRLRALNRPGQHLWVMTAAWHVADPERLGLGGQLDAENLTGIAGPGCYKCEREYSRKLASRPCTGRL